MNIYAVVAALAVLTLAACNPPSSNPISTNAAAVSESAKEQAKPQPKPMPDAGDALTLSQLSSDLFAQRVAAAMDAGDVPKFDDRSLQVESPHGRVGALRYAETGMMEVASFNRDSDKTTPFGKGREVYFLIAAMPIMTRSDAESTIAAMLLEEKASGYIAKRDLLDERISVSSDSGLMVMVEKIDR